MASVSVTTLLSHLSASTTTLDHFASQTRKWYILSARLYDLTSSISAASLTLKAWQRKYDIHDRRPSIYMHVLFSRLGWERIAQCLESIESMIERVGKDVQSVVDCALSNGTAMSDYYDADYMKTCLYRLYIRPTRSHRFFHRALSHAAALDLQIQRLYRKLGVLERLSDLYLEIEHPDLFAKITKRLPGRRMLRDRDDGGGRELLDAVSKRRDAELLYRASVSSSSTRYEEEGEDIETVHIGLHVPQIHRRDFAFLIELPHGLTQELLSHPVKIKAVHEGSRIPHSLATALPKLLQNTSLDPHTAAEPTYILPSMHSTSGFQLSFPPSSLLTPLSLKDPLSTIITQGGVRSLCQQTLAPRDRTALTCSLATGVFRLLGTPWADSLCTTNIRYRRDSSGHYLAILSARPSAASTTRALQGWGNSAPRRDEEKRGQIFRLGVLLAEMCMGIPVTQVAAPHPSSSWTEPQIFIEGMGEQGAQHVEAVEIAAEVELRTNMLVGNVVYWCLSFLEEGFGVRDGDVDRRFYRDVLGCVDELEWVVSRGEGRWVGTPRDQGSRMASNRSSVVF